MNAISRHWLIVEDMPEYERWLRSVLMQHFPQIHLHSCSDLASASRWLRNSVVNLELAMIDLSLPDGSGIELVAALRRDHPQVTTVVTTIFDDDDHVFGALAAGAQGYLLKDDNAEDLVRHLHAIASGTPPLSPAIARRMLEHFRTTAAEQTGITVLASDATPEPHLTPREIEVLRYIGRGLRVMETARLLNVSENTVAGYVKSLYRKLNVSSRAEAALEAARRGLV